MSASDDGPEDETGRPARVVEQVRLLIDDGRGADPKRNLSAGTRLGASLFLAADEAAAIERLTPAAPGRWSSHVRFQLKDLIELDAPDEEVDIEGLAAEDGWLWVLGSHARTRRKPGKAREARIDLADLADLKDTRPRCVLARLPLIPDPGAPEALRPVRTDGLRRAGMIRQTRRGSKLAEVLARDPLLAPFTRIPAKEGGVDIEGVAVAGDRLALGMRGPVIADAALLLEVTLRFKPSGRIKLARKPFKRLLDLEGLGVRDLKRCDRDLLILAGPTTGLDGPCALYRWRNWVTDAASDPDKVRLHRPERLFDIPVGRGVDHPEGLALWDGPEGQGSRILVLCDSPAPRRFEPGTGAFLADVFDLPR